MIYNSTIRIMANNKYNLKQITDISNSGFYYEMPEDIFDIINYICVQVGSSTMKSRIFVKNNQSISANDNSNEFNSSYCPTKNRKKRGNKGMEISNDDWESIRTFQTTTIEQNIGIENDINALRLYLNKLTDKTFLDMREKIIEKINTIFINSTDKEDETKVGTMLYEICSTNKFYSKIFADLFAELALTYGWLNVIFKRNYAEIMNQYNNIQYIDSEKDYDGFCEMNKNNDKRRAITTFYYNLALNGFIVKSGIVNILKDILISIMNMIKMNDKKNEVDELTEIVGILFNKDMIEEVDDESDDLEEYYVIDQSIINTVSSLAQKKVKEFPSLSNKAIFKYMDLIEM
jgi:hypothetical protein